MGYTGLVHPARAPCHSAPNAGPATAAFEHPLAPRHSPGELSWGRERCVSRCVTIWVGAEGTCPTPASSWPPQQSSGLQAQRGRGLLGIPSPLQETLVEGPPLLRWWTGFASAAPPAHVLQARLPGCHPGWARDPGEGGDSGTASMSVKWVLEDRADVGGTDRGEISSWQYILNPF